MNRARKTSLALVAILMSPMAANAGLTYTFNYDAFDSYDAASISFTASDFVTTEGTSLSYLGGGINGCAPTTISYLSLGAFGTPIFDTTACGDGPGPLVDGLFFRSDINPPLTTGTFVSTSGAGRLFGISGGAVYEYVGGSLTISTNSVPEPGTLALLGAGLLGVGFARRRKKTQDPFTVCRRLT